MEYVEKRIVVEDVDKWFQWFPEPGPGLLASGSYSRRTNIPLELGLTTTSPERRNGHVNVLSVQAVRRPALLAI
jgi:hypothetical protein